MKIGNSKSTAARSKVDREEAEAMSAHELHDDGFVVPGMISLSASALNLARDFGQTVRRSQGGDWVVIFDWAHSVSVRREPEATSEEIGACLMIGAFKRSDVPPGFTQTIDGIEFAIKIPRDVWQRSTRRLIDLDETLLFKLALR